MSSYVDSDFAPPSSLNQRKPVPAPEPTSETPTTVAPAHETDNDAIPALTTYPATDVDAKVEALHLIADSIAQQRNFASRTLIYHPFTVAIISVLFALVYKRFYKGEYSDWATIGTTMTGLVMAVLAAIRWAAGAYIDEAEKVGTWKWLDQGRTETEEKETGLRVLGHGDEVLLTKFGEEIIGTIVFRGVQPIPVPASPTKKSRRAASSSSQAKTQIRGWTVRQKYRHKGVGTALLEDAIRIGTEKGWAGGFEFPSDHANHKRVLPAFFNGTFEKNEELARKLLAEKVQEYENARSASGKRRR